MYDKGKWIFIAALCEKLASEALRNGSHSFYAATKPHLPLPRKAFTRRRYHRSDSDSSHLIAEMLIYQSREDERLSWPS